MRRRRCYRTAAAAVGRIADAVVGHSSRSDLEGLRRHTAHRRRLVGHGRTRLLEVAQKNLLVLEGQSLSSGRRWDIAEVGRAEAVGCSLVVDIGIAGCSLGRGTASRMAVARRKSRRVRTLLW